MVVIGVCAAAGTRHAEWSWEVGRWLHLHRIVNVDDVAWLLAGRTDVGLATVLQRLVDKSVRGQEHVLLHGTNLTPEILAQLQAPCKCGVGLMSPPLDELLFEKGPNGVTSAHPPVMDAFSGDCTRQGFPVVSSRITTETIAAGLHALGLA